MYKEKFLEELRDGLNGLPQEDIEERITFYNEMIDDRIEEGLSEIAAVSAVGTVDDIIAQVIQDIPMRSAVRTKARRRLSTGEIILLVLGSPIWLSLLIAVFAVLLSVYISLWAVIISLWAVFASLCVSALGGVIACILFTIAGNGTSGLLMLCSGLICAGLSIFLFFGCKLITKGTFVLTKNLALRMKERIVKKEEA